MNDEKQTNAPKITPVTREAAGKLVDDFLDFYDVDINDIEDDTAQKSHKATCNRIRRAVEKGRLVIVQENGFPILYQHLKHEVKGLPGVLRYREIDGTAKMRAKDLDMNAYGRLYALVAGMTGQKVEDVARLIGQDLSIAEALGGVFLGV